MGLFDRMKRTARPSVPLAVTGTVRRWLVANEYHPGAYKATRPGETVTVELVAERDNEYDVNAVAAHLGPQVAGYLGHGPAAKYRPVIQQANALGYRVSASGVVETVDGSRSVRLSLPTPEALAAWLALPDDQRADGFPA